MNKLLRKGIDSPTYTISLIDSRGRALRYATHKTIVSANEHKQRLADIFPSCKVTVSTNYN